MNSSHCQMCDTLSNSVMSVHKKVAKLDCEMLRVLWSLIAKKSKMKKILYARPVATLPGLGSDKQQITRSSDSYRKPLYCNSWCHGKFVFWCLRANGHFLKHTGRSHREYFMQEERTGENEGGGGGFREFSSRGQVTGKYSVVHQQSKYHHPIILHTGSRYS